MGRAGTRWEEELKQDNDDTRQEKRKGKKTTIELGGREAKEEKSRKGEKSFIEKEK